MGRIINLILLAAIVVAAVATYDMKHKAELAAEHVAALQGDIAKEKRQLTMLRAEWSMLTQPGQLQDAVTKYTDHFNLAPFTPDQIASVDEIRQKPTGIDSKASETLARIAAGETGPKPVAAKR
jgi:hypothetical protein